ncbi:MAG: flagellar hook capping FlgD N-terminal domain-containing protein [Lachnospiraceae bacterium]
MSVDFNPAAYSAKGTTRTTSDAENQKKIDKNKLEMDDFLQLLAAQLKYQDMSSPMDNAAMMQQLTQMSSVTAMNGMSAQMTNVADISTITYASSMLGKEVTVVTGQNEETKELETTKGVVSGVGFYEGFPAVYIDGKAYSLSQIMSVGTVPVPEPPKPEDPDKPTDPPKLA